MRKPNIVTTIIGLALIAVSLWNLYREGFFDNLFKRFSRKDNSGITFKVKRQERFIISLDSNPTTGYSWQLSRPLNERVVKFIHSQYRHPQDASVGRGGRELWTFEAVARGGAEIYFEYVRPWEKGSKPQDNKLFIIIVEE